MGQPEHRTVQLVDGPADGRTVQVAHAWVFVAVQDDELLVFDIDADQDRAAEVLERVPHGGWTHYVQARGHPDVFRPAEDYTAPITASIEDTGLPLWYLPRWSSAPHSDRRDDPGEYSPPPPVTSRWPTGR